RLPLPSSWVRIDRSPEDSVLSTLPTEAIWAGDRPLRRPVNDGTAPAGRPAPSSWPTPGRLPVGRPLRTPLTLPTPPAGRSARSVLTSGRFPAGTAPSSWPTRDRSLLLSDDSSLETSGTDAADTFFSRSPRTGTARAEALKLPAPVTDPRMGSVPPADTDPVVGADA